MFRRARNIFSIVVGFFVLFVTLDIFVYPAFAQTDDEKRIALQQNLDQLEKEAGQLDTFIGQTKQEAISLASAKKNIGCGSETPTN